MRASKKAKLTSRGWKVGDTREFLDLSPEEAALIELRLKLADAARPGCGCAIEPVAGRQDGIRRSNRFH